MVGAPDIAGMIVSSWICLNLVPLASNGFVSLQNDYFGKILNRKCNNSQWLCTCAENCPGVFRERSCGDLDRQGVETITIIWFLNQIRLLHELWHLSTISAVNVVTNRFRVYGIEMCIAGGYIKRARTRRQENTYLYQEPYEGCSLKKLKNAITRHAQETNEIATAQLLALPCDSWNSSHKFHKSGYLRSSRTLPHCTGSAQLLI